MTWLLTFDAGNFFTTPTPFASCLLNHPSVVFLNVSHNSFTGNIPNSSISAGLPLQTLDMHANQLTGPIPSAFATYSSLAYLDISENMFAGQFPTSNVLVNLQTCNVNTNLVCIPAGSSPPAICNLYIPCLQAAFASSSTRSSTRSTTTAATTATTATRTSIAPNTSSSTPFAIFDNSGSDNRIEDTVVFPDFKGFTQSVKSFLVSTVKRSASSSKDGSNQGNGSASDVCVQFYEGTPYSRVYSPESNVQAFPVSLIFFGNITIDSSITWSASMTLSSNLTTWLGNYGPNDMDALLSAIMATRSVTSSLGIIGNAKLEGVFVDTNKVTDVYYGTTTISKMTIASSPQIEFTPQKQTNVDVNVTDPRTMQYVGTTFQLQASNLKGVMQTLNLTGQGTFNMTGGSLALDLTLSRLDVCGQAASMWYDFILANKVYFISGAAALVIIVGVSLVFKFRYRKPKPTKRQPERVASPKAASPGKQAPDAANRGKNMLNY